MRRVSALNLAVRYRGIGFWTIVLYFGQSLNQGTLSSVVPAGGQGEPQAQARCFQGNQKLTEKSPEKILDN
jgi:hypothetical protein